MTTDTLSPATDAPDELLSIDAPTADLLFREARTVVRFDDGHVSDQQVQAAYDLVRWGPTAMNTLPLRLLLVRTPEARERLVSHMAEGNKPKTLDAPLTIVAAADPNFHEHLPVLAPHVPGAREMFEGNGPEGRAPMATQSTLIQVGYLIVGLRAAGLHVGPMSGFDTAGVDAEFFADNGWRSQLVINVGTPASEGASYPRQTRLGFDQVSAAV
ncbi:malonic semialdehyde reductase [Cellulomonas sp. PhB143]|uniref:malonic semialdehyde reductase n=1 Tax=Cellulomonas sp. PhB143 TaxID=2485186 RepID=UPI000F48BD31|nr:malonic semialdehyde reductase [Cellulomonas sp. PhB143]ROS76829.1 3-hydroxypropanoate dehydrogenase [Cellulomonas sp. PhB143]